jgi:hypothetical protein
LPLALFTLIGATSTFGAYQHGNSMLPSFAFFTFNAILLSFNIGAFMEHQRITRGGNNV